MKLDVPTLQKRWQNRAVLAISLETAEVAVALLKREGAEVRSGESCTLPLGADAISADPDRAGAALAEALERAKIRERRCVVCLPRRWALSAAAEVPEVSGEDLRAFLELRAEREFSVPLNELRLAHSLFKLPDGKQHATLAAVPAKRLDAVNRMLEAAGCRAVSISLGLDRSANLATAAGLLEFQANCDHVDLIVAAGGGVTALRTLPGPTDAAFDPAAFWREVRITLGRLPEAVRNDVAEARFAGAPATVATLVQNLEVPLRRLGIARVEVEPAGAAAHPAIDAASQYLRDRPVLFELMPRAPSRWQAALTRFDGRRRRWAALAGVALILLPMLVFMIRSHMESSLSDEWKSMQGEVAELEALQQRIRQFRPWFEPAPQALHCLETLIASFPEPGDVWAKSAQVAEGGKVTCVGFAKGQPAILGLLDRLRARAEVSGLQLQQVRGENPVQFTITYQWEAKNAP